MKKQSLIRGTLVLGIGGIFAKFLGIFFRWPLIMLIGDEGIGYYQMSYPLYVFFIAAASGVPVAISKMVSERNAVGDKAGVLDVLKKSFMFMIIMGLGFSLFLFVFSQNLINLLKWSNKSYYSLIGIALAPFFVSIVCVFRGFFQGLQNMNPTAVSQIIEQIGRVIVGIGLAYILLPYGIEYSAGGAAFGAAAGAVFAGIYLFHKYNTIKKGVMIKNRRFSKDTLDKLLYTAIPISLGATTGSIMSLIDSIIVPQKLLQAGLSSRASVMLYGQLTGKAYVLVNVPLTVSMALCSSIVPIIAEASILNRKFEVSQKIQMTIQISLLISLPCFLGLFFMAEPVLKLLFPNHFEGYTILKFLSISIPFIALSQSMTAILQGTGKYIQPVFNLGAGCIVKIIITWLLVPIPYINIYGSVIGTISGYAVACILNLLLLERTFKTPISCYIVLKPALISLIMIICVVFIYRSVYNNTLCNPLSCLLSIFSGMIIYLILIFAFKIFKYDDLKKRILRNKGE